jgi:hypothetical protein
MHLVPGSLRILDDRNHLLMFALEQVSKVADWLTSANFSAQQSDIIAKRQKDTGLWLLNSEEYKVWIGEERQTLFCLGIPGAGVIHCSGRSTENLWRQ